MPAANEERATSWQVSRWIFYALAALLLYVLSIGPAAALVLGHGFSSALYFQIYAPLFWIIDKAPVIKGPLEVYAGWWVTNF